MRTPSPNTPYPTRLDGPSRSALPFGIVVLLFLVLVTWPVLLNASRWCYAYYDLGIYADAIGRLSFQTPNPWLDARQLKIFNDHFDPILWVASPLVSAGMPPHFVAIVTESLFALTATLPIFCLYARSVISRRSAVTFICILLFNVAAIDALTFPAHPTTWAMAPFFWLILSLHFQRYVWTLISAFLLCACKEEFPFACMMVGVVLLAKGKHRWSLLVALISFFWIICAFVVRPYFSPITSNYASALFSGLREDPVAYAIRRMTAPGMWSRIGSIILTLAPTAIWLKRDRLRVEWWLFLPLLPTVAIRVLGMSWRAQYNACVLSGIAAALVPSLQKKEMPRWVCVCTLLALVCTNQNQMLAAANSLLGRPVKGKEYCAANNERLQSIRSAAVYLARRENGTVLASQNLVLTVDNTSGVFALGGPQTGHTPTYDFVFVEKPPHGVAWPYDHSAISSAIAAWSASAQTEIISNDEYTFLARGQFIDPTPRGQFQSL